jgi:hypothetical protein
VKARIVLGLGFAVLLSCNFVVELSQTAPHSPSFRLDFRKPSEYPYNS